MDKVIAEIPLIGCVDVQYREATARSAIVIVEGWASDKIVAEAVSDNIGIEEYKPGEFSRRELPCLLSVVASVPHAIDVLVVDGYVWLDELLKPGLGAKLYESLNPRIPIVGIAKTRFRGSPAVEVIRGNSNRPLFVTAVGLPVDDAARHVSSMHGPYRIPTIVRKVDQLARSLEQ